MSEQSVPVDLAKLMAFYEEAARKRFARPEGAKDICLIPEGQHCREGFEVHRYEGPAKGWFYEDVCIWTPRAHAGTEVVYHKNRPVWIHQYNGFVGRDEYQTPEGEAKLLEFLQLALRVRKLQFQPHGPELFEKGGWRYHCKMRGDITDFSGVESIFHEGEVAVYSSFFQGRMVI